MMKIGILGTGFGAYHGTLYNTIDRVESVSIYGRTQEKLDLLQASYHKTVDTPDALIDDPSILLVDICLPSAVHAPYAIQALKSGKHVFIETPVVLNMIDANKLLEASREASGQVFVNMFIRFEPANVYLYDQVKNGTLGKLKALHIRRKTPPLWGDLSLNRIVSNLMIHDFDFATWLLGKPQSIQAVGCNGDNQSAHVSAHLLYEDAIVEIQGSSMLPDNYAFTVGYEAIFEHGTIEFLECGSETYFKKSLRVFDANGIHTVALPDENCYEKSLRHVVACCEKNEASPLISLEEAIQSISVALEVERQVIN